MKLYYFYDDTVLCPEENWDQYIILANSPQEALDCLHKNCTPSAMEYHEEAWIFKNYTLAISDTDPSYESILSKFITYTYFKELSYTDLTEICSIIESEEFIPNIYTKEPCVLSKNN